MKDKLDDIDIKLILKCAEYSYDAYVDINNKNKNGFFVENKHTDTQSYLSISDDTIIFSGQGTTTLIDWTNNFRLWRKKISYLENTLVHSGFIKSYDSIRHEIYSKIEEIRSMKKIKKIVCTGHSLFGAIATIAALDFSIKYKDLLIECVTFGSPRVGSKNFAKLFNKNINKSFRCVRLKDPIAFTPFPGRFKHVSGGIHLIKNDISLKVPLYNFCGCRIAHHSMDEYLEHIRTISLQSAKV